MGAITIDQPRKCRSPWSWSVQYRLLVVAKVHWRCLWARRDKCHVNWHKLTVSGARQARWCSDEIGWVGDFDLLNQRFDRGALWHRRRGMTPWQRAVSVLLRGHSTRPIVPSWISSPTWQITAFAPFWRLCWRTKWWRHERGGYELQHKFDSQQRWEHISEVKQIHDAVEVWLYSNLKLTNLFERTYRRTPQRSSL